MLHFFIVIFALHCLRIAGLGDVFKPDTGSTEHLVFSCSLIHNEFFFTGVGMLRRPKPTDSESDLLQEQEHFLASGSKPAASVKRRADKRRGDNTSADSDESSANQRDVVTIEGSSFQINQLINPSFESVTQILSENATKLYIFLIAE